MPPQILKFIFGCCRFFGNKKYIILKNQNRITSSIFPDAVVMGCSVAETTGLCFVLLLSILVCSCQHSWFWAFFCFINLCIFRFYSAGDRRANCQTALRWRVASFCPGISWGSSCSCWGGGGYGKYMKQIYMCVWGGGPWASLQFEKFRGNIDSFRGFIEIFSLFWTEVKL